MGGFFLSLSLYLVCKHHDASHTFAPLDQILEDADFPAIRHLETISSLGTPCFSRGPADVHFKSFNIAGSVALVCETRGGGSMRAFRLDKSKVMQWLHAKVLNSSSLRSGGSPSSIYFSLFFLITNNKVLQVEQQLTESGVNMSQAALSDGFKASTHVSADDRLR